MQRLDAERIRMSLATCLLTDLRAFEDQSPIWSCYFICYGLASLRSPVLFIAEQLLLMMSMY